MVAQPSLKVVANCDDLSPRICKKNLYHIFVDTKTVSGGFFFHFKIQLV